MSNIPIGTLRNWEQKLMAFIENHLKRDRSMVVRCYIVETSQLSPQLVEFDKPVDRPQKLSRLGSAV